jgi:hypothetical protein
LNIVYIVVIICSEGQHAKGTNNFAVLTTGMRNNALFAVDYFISNFSRLRKGYNLMA